MPRAELVVDLDALTHNVATLRSRCSPAQMMTVVKADGYGHGLVPSARAARRGGAEWLGVAVIEEALALRRAGDTGRVLAWLWVPGEDLTDAVAAGVDLTAYSHAELDDLVAAGERADVVPRVQLKVDTGLSRGGAPPADWPGLVRTAAAAERAGSLRLTGVWSHLACADEPGHPANDDQEKAFREAVDVAREAGLQPEVVHLANSAAALTRPTVHFDLVRVGLAAYGLTPIPALQSSAQLGLVPVMTARSALAQVREVPAGSGVSYGHRHVTEHPTRLGLVPVGYADGLPRHASGTGPLSVGGRRVVVTGQVCMDQVVVDLGPGADEQAGAPVVIFGTGADGGPTAQDWAQAAGTISYEIVTGMRGRFTRRYVGGA